MNLPECPPDYVCKWTQEPRFDYTSILIVVAVIAVVVTLSLLIIEIGKLRRG